MTIKRQSEPPNAPPIRTLSGDSIGGSEEAVEEASVVVTVPEIEKGIVVDEEGWETEFC